MAIYDSGTASLAASGFVTGVGTTWQAQLTLIRVGATIVFKTEPVKIYTISEIISDTQINVYNPNSETIPAGTGYAILAHDGITVQGLAQDVAETLRYYQSRESEVATAVDAFKDFDQDKFSSDVTQVNTQYGQIVTIGAQVSRDASKVASDKSAAAASATSANSSKNSAAASAQEAADYAASLNTENLLRKDLNFSDVADKALARTNLDVYSKSEVDSKTTRSIVSPESFGAIGNGVASDIGSFRSACLSGYDVRCKKGARYMLPMTEANVITLPAGVDVDLNGSTLVVPNTGYLVFLLKNARCSVRNGKIEYRGGYPSSAVATTRYGISRPHEAAFCGLIGLNTTGAQDITIDNIEVYGATDSNLYDFVVSGYEGSFARTKISRIRASHYACVVINNFHGVHMQGLYGTKRHNKSSLVYGPSHLAYVSINNGSIRDVYETGALISNESTMGYAGATVQTTDIDGAFISNINTTMGDVGALSIKVGGVGFFVSDIYSRSSATFSQPQALVEIQTNSQAIIMDGYISNVRVYLPTGNLGCVGYRHGGTRVKARNIYVDVPYTDGVRTSEVAMLVTSDYPDVEIDIRSSRQDSKVLLSAFNNGRLKVNNLNNPLSFVSGTSITGASWGECLGTEVSIDDNPLITAPSTVDVGSATSSQCIFNFAGWYGGDYYRHIINQSVTTDISLRVPVRIPPASVSTSDHNVLVYEIDVVASSIAGSQAVSSKHFVYLVGGQSSVVGTTKDIIVTQLGSMAILPTIAYAGSQLTVTVTRQSGGENLRDLVVRARLVNNRPHV